MGIRNLWERIDTYSDATKSIVLALLAIGAIGAVSYGVFTHTSKMKRQIEAERQAIVQNLEPTAPWLGLTNPRISYRDTDTIPGLETWHRDETGKVYRLVI